MTATDSRERKRKMDQIRMILTHGRDREMKGRDWRGRRRKRDEGYREERLRDYVKDRDWDGIRWDG